jgi:hypothetical protein
VKRDWRYMCSWRRKEGGREGGVNGEIELALIDSDKKGEKEKKHPSLPPSLPPSRPHLYHTQVPVHRYGLPHPQLDGKVGRRRDEAADTALEGGRQRGREGGREGGRES